VSYAICRVRRVLLNIIIERVTDQSNADPTAADEAREIVGLFRSLRRHLVRGSRAELARSGLTAAQVSVISLLGTNQAMTLGELSRELELSHSTVSGIVDRLQAKDLVVRLPSPTDRRYVQISLAEYVANQAPALGDEGPIGRLEAVLKAAPAEERRMVKEGLALLVRFADQARLLPSK
jgi:DNA-binding MarR family transcriptional regulator